MISIGLIKRLIRAVSSIRCKNMKERRIRVRELKIFGGVASIRIFEEDEINHDQSRQLN